MEKGKENGRERVEKGRENVEDKKKRSRLSGGVERTQGGRRNV